MPPISKQAEQLETLIREFIDQYNHVRKTLLKRYKIEETQFSIIEFIAQPDLVYMKELGKEFDIKLTTLTFAIDRLEKKRLVKRKTSKKDRRVVHVQLASRGIQLLDELKSINKNLAIQLVKDFRQKEMGMLIHGLERILNKVWKQTENP